MKVPSKHTKKLNCEDISVDKKSIIAEKKGNMYKFSKNKSKSKQLVSGLIK